MIHAGPLLLVGAACTLQTPPSLLPLHSALVQAAVLGQEISLNLLSNELLGTNLGVEVKPDISIYTRPLRWTPVFPYPTLRSPCFHRLQDPPWPQFLRGVPSLVQVMNGCTTLGVYLSWHVCLMATVSQEHLYAFGTLWPPQNASSAPAAGAFLKHILSGSACASPTDTVMAQNGFSFQCCFHQCPWWLHPAAMGPRGGPWPPPTPCTAAAPTT